MLILKNRGFKDELEQIISHCPKQRQTMLFSATMTDQVDLLIGLSLKNPVRIKVDDQTNVPEKLNQEFIKIRHEETDKESILLWLCSKTFTSRIEKGNKDSKKEKKRNSKYRS